MDTNLIAELIDQSEHTILNSVDEAGYPISRVMLAVRKRVDLKDFYFSTKTHSNKVKHFHDNPKSSLYFFDKMRFIGCLLQGEMLVLDDADNRNMIWREGDEHFYPEGIMDPNFTVLKFTAKKIITYYNFKSEEIVL